MPQSTLCYPRSARQSQQQQSVDVRSVAREHRGMAPRSRGVDITTFRWFQPLLAKALMAQARGMRRINYVGSWMYTGDRIADALFAYAAALARSGGADVVDFPGRGADGRLTRLRVVIGPASQLEAEDLTSGEGWAEVVDDAVVARLERLTAALNEGRDSQPPATFPG